MSMEARVGVLSTAWIASLIVPLIKASDAVDVVAVGSRSSERAEAFASALGISRAYGSYEELIEADDIDLVYVALPNALHAHWVKVALEAGKHVLCEKPLAPTAAEAEALFALAEERGRLLAEGFMYRHHPQTSTALDLIGAGEIGEPRSIDCWFHTKAADPEMNVRYKAELAGGALYDVGSYCVSFANLIAGGEPLDALGVSRRSCTGVDETFSALMRYAGGLTATFDCGMDSWLSTGVRVVGTEGTMTIANPWLPDLDVPIWGGAMPPSEVVVSRGTDAKRFPCPSHDPYRLQFENFSSAIAGEETLLLTRQETLINLRTIERLHAGAADQQRERMTSVGG